MNPSHSHFLLVLKDSVISVQISQLIRDFNFQLCAFILKLSKNIEKCKYFFRLTSVCLFPLNFRLILSMLSIREQILLRTFLKSFMWFLSRWRTFFLASSFFFFSSLFNQLDMELNNRFVTYKKLKLFSMIKHSLYRLDVITMRTLSERYEQNVICKLYFAKFLAFGTPFLHRAIQKKCRIHISYWVFLNCFYEPK